MIAATESLGIRILQALGLFVGMWFLIGVVVFIDMTDGITDPLSRWVRWIMVIVTVGLASIPIWYPWVS